VAPGLTAALSRAVAEGDLDELIRLVDRLCSGDEWEALLVLRDRARRAYLDHGRQLWPVASHAEYRLALEAPAPAAAAVLEEGAGRFALGPLPEVAASSHTWAQLGPLLPPTVARTLFGHERVVRGDDLRGEEGLDTSVLDLPAVVEGWEPAYAVASYRPDRASFPTPPPLPLRPVTLPSEPGATVADPTAAAALRALVDPWVTASNGAVAVTSVRGGAEQAVTSLGHRRVGWAEATLADALAAMAWAGASGGAHGRRRGAAMGRFGAWWALSTLVGLTDEDVTPDELGAAGAELRWALWSPADPAPGWALRLAVEDPPDGLAWAVEATDQT
jgi:hypothetical protein